MSRLFNRLKIRDVEFKNRIFMAPMCQYACTDGMLSDWPLVHYGARAAGGASLLIFEASAVSPEGRITPGCSGIWDDKFIEPFKQVTRFIKEQDCVPGIQIAHAGRKASTYIPWKGSGTVPQSEGGWETIAPSPLAFSPEYAAPRELSIDEIKTIPAKFASAAARAVKAGFEVIEIHMAHGYLMHQFLSPVSNKRSDEYGGSLENRCRLAVETARMVRNAMPASLPLFVRISCTDWIENGWDLEQSLYLISMLKDAGVDFIDASTAGNVFNAQIPVAPGYQVPFAERIKKDTGILTGTVGLITTAPQAEEILANDKADAILLGRVLLNNPHWPLFAAKELNENVTWPNQYLRARL